MKLLILLTIIGVCTALSIETSGRLRTSYDSDNFAYVPPQPNNNLPGYDYPKPLPDVQPPKVNRLYLPVDTTSSTTFEPPLQQLPSENKPRYAGTGNYIFEIQSHETNSHTVDVENPLFRNRIHFNQ